MQPDLVQLDDRFEYEDLNGLMLAVPRSPLWEKVRREFAILHPKCAACGGAKLIQIHHVLPFHLYPKLELDKTNLITLCEDPARICHHRIGHCWDWKAYNPHVCDDARTALKRVIARAYSAA